MAFKLGRCAAAVISLFIVVGLFVRVAPAQDTSTAVEREFARAIQLHQSGDLEGAVSAYLAILATYPARVDVRSNLGAAYSALGRYEEAIEQYKRALIIDSSNHALRFNL